MGNGYNRLWAWFGCSRASWLTIPRVLMHEMPDDWQERMSKLLEEYDNEFNNQNAIDFDIYVQARKKGKITWIPQWLNNYRHPNKKQIDTLRIKDETN